MDVNQLLHDHQIARLFAQFAGTPSNRSSSVDRTGETAARITAWRNADGLSIAGWPRDERCALPEQA